MDKINLDDYTMVLPEHLSVKQSRIALGLTVDQVAEMAKIKPEHLELYEEGSRRISPFTRRRLLRAVDKSSSI